MEVSVWYLNIMHFYFIWQSCNECKQGKVSGWFDLKTLKRFPFNTHLQVKTGIPPRENLCGWVWTSNQTTSETYNYNDNKLKDDVCLRLQELYQNSVNLWRAQLLLYIAYFTALHALGLWLAVNAICSCWGDFYDWLCAVRDASYAFQETHSSKVYRIWL